MSDDALYHYSTRVMQDIQRELATILSQTEALFAVREDIKPHPLSDP
jgi:hypothetical protein